MKTAIAITLLTLTATLGLSSYGTKSDDALVHQAQITTSTRPVQQTRLYAPVNIPVENTRKLYAPS